MIEKIHSIHVTHNDGDAIGCALVAGLVFPDTDIADNTYFCAIGTQDDKLKGVLTSEIDKGIIPENVIISDLTLKEETCDWLLNLATEYRIKVAGIDHHASNHLEEKYPNMWHVYNGTYLNAFNSYIAPISAAEAMQFKVFHNFRHNDMFEDLIYMISRYDTWEWKNHPYDWSEKYPGLSDDIVAVNCKFMGPEKCFKELYKWYFSEGIENFFLNVNPKGLVPDFFKYIYDAAKESERSFLNVVPYKAHVVPDFLGKYTIAVIPFENNHVNAACEYIYNNYDYIDIVVVLYVSSNKIGVRTAKKSINLSTFLKEYWGDNAGGHPAAAGATIPKTEMSAALTTYLMNSETLAEYDENMKGRESSGNEEGN